MRRAGPGRPLASVGRRGGAVVKPPASTMDTNRLTCPGHTGPTVAVYTEPEAVIAIERHVSPAVDPRQTRTTSEDAEAEAVTCTPARSLFTWRIAGSGSGAAPSKAHARNRFAGG